MILIDCIQKLKYCMIYKKQKIIFKSENNYNLITDAGELTK